MNTLTVSIIAIVTAILIPIIASLIKLYGDIRVLRANDTKNSEYVVDSEKARHEVVAAVGGIKKDIEYIKKDVEKNEKFRGIFYDRMLNDSPVKHA